MRKGEPLYFLRAGFIYPWSSYQQTRVVGTLLQYWSSTASPFLNAQFLKLTPQEIYPSSVYYRFDAFLLRCLLLG